MQLIFSTKNTTILTNTQLKYITKDEKTAINLWQTKLIFSVTCKKAHFSINETNKPKDITLT